MLIEITALSHKRKVIINTSAISDVTFSTQFNGNRVAKIALGSGTHIEVPENEWKKIVNECNFNIKQIP